ncbi:MAG: peptidoglycan-binding protein LysM [Geminicoccaceae bacterium]|nr:peptidoglycan-binding protein LysM [Geminicoccaceae bacterium]
MGLWSFLTGSGKAVDKDEDGKPSPDALKKEVSDLGLKVDGLDVAVDGDKVKVTGKAPDQATREKVMLALGNVEGVSSVEDDIKTDKQEPESRTRTVQKGDTLSKIAKEAYGDAGKYPVIFEANKPMLKDPDKIYPGQLLRIPPIGAA